MNIFKNLKLTTQVSITIILLLFLIFIIGGISLIGINKIGYEIEEIAEEDMPLIEIFTQISINQLKQAVLFERILHASNNTQNITKTKEDFFRLDGIINNNFTTGEIIIQRTLDIFTGSDRAIQEANKINKFLTSAKQKYQEYIKQVQKIFQLLNKEKITNNLIEKIEILEDELDKELSNSLMQIEKFTEKSISIAEQQEKNILLVVLLVTLLALLLGILNGISIIRTLSKFIKQINELDVKNEQEDWLKTGQAKLNEQISGEQKITKLAKNIISFLTTYIEAQVGLFYLMNPDEKLQVIANYAYTIQGNTPTTFNLGESLVGQAALEQKVISVTQTPTECPLIIRSGLAGALPQHILLLPFLYENDLKGIIEIGSATEITAIQRSFLEQIMSIIGIAVNTAESHTKMQALLDKSQQQAEELQLKQKEMQQTNEELQSQSEELQSQSEELQTQQEELKQTNEILEERTRNLEQQKTETQDKNQALEINRVEMEKTQAAIALKAKELELASKYKSEFLANMSHELRTPLNSLLILAQLLVDNKPDTLTEKQIEYAKTIHSAGKDLLSLINDILDLSKVEAGKVEVQWENISLSNLLTMIEQKFSPIAEDKKLKFSIKISDDIPQILTTDSQRIKQIINNLLSNAFKFTSAGKVKLLVQHPTKIPTNIGGNVLELGKTIAITVTDSGIGIPKDKQQTIFEAFQQADGSTSRRYGGTGLGLSISRQLARLLGGELALTSEIDQGSTFTLFLPEQVPNQIEEPLLQPPPILKKSTEKLPQLAPVKDDRHNLQPGDKSILFIEDDRKFSDILKDLACDKGFKHLLAEDGITGLQLAMEYKPNAIILDVGLPQLNGWSVMERLKDNPETRHIPVHFMSAADQRSIDAKKMGAIGYLLKPISMEKLKDAFLHIEQFLARIVKNLLLVTDTELHQQEITGLLTGENIQIKQSSTIESAIENLQMVTYDCIILDMGIENGSGNKLLERMQQEKEHCQIPIIAYSTHDLTVEEEALLMRCSDKIPIKSVSSLERLLDEATLFLHQIESKLSNEKRNMLHMVHDKEAILKNKKVLIVDDDVRNVFALATVLEENNMETICAVNGHEGLKLLEDNSDVAIVLMDIMMPEMDGYESMHHYIH